MKHFPHSQNPMVILKRTRHSNISSTLIGQMYEIVEMNTKCGKKPGEPCPHGGDPNCPGRIKLDRAPFDKEIECWSWNGKSIFDFL